LASGHVGKGRGKDTKRTADQLEWTRGHGDKGNKFRGHGDTGTRGTPLRGPVTRGCVRTRRSRAPTYINFELRNWAGLRIHI
jgi:hypothetical protein